MPRRGEIPMSAEPAREEKEARFSGLPTREDIDQKLSLISSGIEARDKTRGAEFVKIPRASKAEKISEEVYEGFKKEFAEDVRDFALRIQRLKIRVLSHYLAGSLPSEEGASYEEREAGPGGRLSEVASKFWYSRNREKFDDEKQRYLVSEFNKYLPDKYKLDIRSGLSEHDARILYDFSTALRFGPQPKEKQQKILELMLGEISEIEKELSTIQDQGELFGHDDKVSVTEKRFSDLWDRYRELLKQIAGFEELGSWFSPTHGSSGKGQRGERQHSEPFRTDYQRFMMPEAEALDSRLTIDYFGRIKGEAKSVLFNSGLNALQAIFEVVDDDTARFEDDGRKKPSRPIFKTGEMYFEADSSINGHYSRQGIKPEAFREDQIDVLIERIKKDRPAAVYLAPVSNEYHMRVVEVTKLFEALSDRTWVDKVYGEMREKGRKFKDHLIYPDPDPIYIVIDNTVLGRLARWKDFDFNRLPGFIKVISYESLVKYGEDGQEVAQAGLATGIGRFGDDHLKMVRSRQGFMPPENTVRKLMGVAPPDLTDKKMARHSRNGLVLAKELEEERRKTKNSFIKDVVFPDLPSHPQHAAAERELKAGGGLLNITFDLGALLDYEEAYEYGRGGVHYARLMRRENDDFERSRVAKTIIEAFEKLVVFLAKEAGVEINMGTSFGFRTTRIAVYQHEIKSGGYRDMYYLRVAVGTENIKDTLMIAKIIRRANQIFVEAMKQHKLLVLERVLKGSHMPDEFQITLG